MAPRNFPTMDSSWKWEHMAYGLNVWFLYLYTVICVAN